MLCYQLPTIIKQFHQQAPRADLFLRSMNCYDIRDELLNGTLDLRIFYEDVGGFGLNLQTYPLGEYKTILVASPETCSRFPDFVTPDQELDVSFLKNEKNCIFMQSVHTTKISGLVH